MTDAILDKILIQKHAEELRTLDPIAVVDGLLKVLPDRERDIVSRRFGIGLYSAPATLEEIGVSLKVTRERIRQVTKAAIERLSERQGEHADLIRFAHIVEQLLRSYGGTLEEHLFTSCLLDLAGVSSTDATARKRTSVYVAFLVQQILPELVHYREESNGVRARYCLTEADEELAVAAATALASVIDAGGTLVATNDLVSKFRETSFYTTHDTTLVDEPLSHAHDLYATNGSTLLPIHAPTDQDILLAYARLSASIEQNIFGDWGRSEWPAIHPKRMNDKIYLILRQEKKPLHFTAISDKINAAHFDQKIARPPSVHNELILDPRFVLVGRGIYALKEWGFERGTVAEVIGGLLRESPGLTRDQIVEQVLHRRFVKRQTVYLALMNRSRFTRRSDGGYVVVS